MATCKHYINYTGSGCNNTLKVQYLRRSVSVVCRSTDKFDKNKNKNYEDPVRVEPTTFTVDLRPRPVEPGRNVGNKEDYFDTNIWSSVELDSIPLKLDKHDLLYLYNHKLKFNQFGLQWAFLDDGILVNSIPRAILGKNPRQEDVVLKAVRRLILEEIDVIKSLGGNVTLYPKAIMDLVFNEACRYAIKFGDKLSKSDCVAMLKMLSTCKTPFQCAHGRPVMAVLIDLPRNIRNYEVNIESIKQFKIRKSI